MTLFNKRPYDRRRVLTEQQRQEIKKLYATGKYSRKALGLKFNCGESTIFYVLHPEVKNLNRVPAHLRKSVVKRKGIVKKLPIAIDIVLPEHLDRRRKLMRKDKISIRSLYKAGKSMKWLAHKFKVSEPTIYYIIHPNRYAIKLKKVKATAHRYHRNKTHNNTKAKETREYKRSLISHLLNKFK